MIENDGLVDFTFEVSEEMSEKLESFAQVFDVTMEQLVLYAINQYLHSQKVAGND